MTTFDERDKGFENKFAHDEEISFKIHARCNKLLGLWAAALLGKHGADAEQYANDIVVAEFENSGNKDVIDKLLKDFTVAGLSLSAKDIRSESDRLMALARKQITGSDH